VSSAPAAALGFDKASDRKTAELSRVAGNPHWRPNLYLNAAGLKISAFEHHFAAF
jgi:hypothetical protein